MNQDLIREYLLESFENLSLLAQELTTLEQQPADQELINSIFRKVHTLKGGAGFLGFKKLQELTHAGESLLDRIREGELKVTASNCDILLEFTDASLEILKYIETHQKEPAKGQDALIARLNQILKPASVTAKLELNEPAILTGIKIPGALFEDNVQTKKASPKVATATVLVEKKEVVVEIKEEKEIPKESKELKEENIDSGKNAGVADSVVRVNVQLLDKIMNVVGELVLSRNQLLQYASTQDLSELNRMAQQLNTITSELQTDIMTTRMQPVGSVLSKFERIVRDLARSQDKKIKLEIIGKETELDKTLLEAIRDPLTHLIRNSVDHGIEKAEVRKQRGKPEEGKIVISAFHESGQVSIEIKDDGNGIDPQKIIAKALQKGILTPDQIKSMSAKQILQIIFMPGFSTAEQVTNISGRGVGMDVVKSNVEKIGGSVDIYSEVGSGSTFKLKIPLTLAIVPALVVKDKGETFAIPQMSLVELVRFETSDENLKLEKLHGSEFFRLRGELIPIFRLSQHLGLKGTKSTSDLISDESVNIVVLNTDGKIYGLIVDLILDTEEIVVKPLSKELKSLSFYAGATIMGDGNVALILDANGFYHHADKGHGQKVDRASQNDELNEETLAQDTQELLLCELGDNRQYAIPLIFVNRLEEFQLSAVEWSGDNALIKYGNIPMPLINLEQSLNLRGENVINAPRPDGIVPCVVIKVRNHLFGLVVKEINDIQQTDGSIHTDSVDRAGLMGTVFIKNKMITMLDLHSILSEHKLGKLIFKSSSKKSRGKILVVDDSLLYQRIHKDFLEEEGFEVTTALNGQDAFEILQADANFKLIITDIEMPIMDGWALSSRIRQNLLSHKATPIIAVSTKVSAHDKEKGSKCGFTEHVDKTDKSILKKIISEYV